METKTFIIVAAGVILGLHFQWVTHEYVKTTLTSCLSGNEPKWTPGRGWAGRFACVAAKPIDDAQPGVLRHNVSSHLGYIAALCTLWLVEGSKARARGLIRYFQPILVAAFVFGVAPVLLAVWLPLWIALHKQQPSPGGLGLPEGRSLFLAALGAVLGTAMTLLMHVVGTPVQQTYVVLLPLLFAVGMGVVVPLFGLLGCVLRDRGPCSDDGKTHLYAAQLYCIVGGMLFLHHIVNVFYLATSAEGVATIMEAFGSMVSCCADRPLLGAAYFLFFDNLSMIPSMLVFVVYDQGMGGVPLFISFTVIFGLGGGLSFYCAVREVAMWNKRATPEKED